MQGFGAAMTDSSAWMLTKKLSCAERQRVMQRQFDRIRMGKYGITIARVVNGCT